MTFYKDDVWILNHGWEGGKESTWKMNELEVYERGGKW
jgi:hypothetical protein